ncbi:hypothetical protein, partial [Pseudomonas aeruginosa]
VPLITEPLLGSTCGIDGSGNWSFTPGIPLPDGTVVNVVARSPSNVDSAPAVITVYGLAPAAPVIDPS